jgi:hypothetical protein
MTLLDSHPKRFVRSDEMFLSDEFIERIRSDFTGEWFHKISLSQTNIAMLACALQQMLCLTILRTHPVQTKK